MLFQTFEIRKLPLIASDWPLRDIPATHEDRIIYIESPFGTRELYIPSTATILNCIAASDFILCKTAIYTTTLDCYITKCIHENSVR
jgi:hypothetical protein